MKDSIHIVIPGQPITKKNSQQILVNPRTKRPFIMPSKQYKKYAAECAECIDYDGDPIDHPVNVKCLYYMKTRRKVDLVNLQEATLDILQDTGVLLGDDNRIVASMDGSRVLYDKDDPRVEITIENHWM